MLLSPRRPRRTPATGGLFPQRASSLRATVGCLAPSLVSPPRSYSRSHPLSVASLYSARVDTAVNAGHVADQSPIPVDYTHTPARPARALQITPLPARTRDSNSVDDGLEPTQMMSTWALVSVSGSRGPAAQLCNTVLRSGTTHRQSQPKSESCVHLHSPAFTTSSRRLVRNTSLVDAARCCRRSYHEGDSGGRSIKFRIV